MIGLWGGRTGSWSTNKTSNASKAGNKLGRMIRKLRSYLDLFPYTKVEERFCTRRSPTHHWILKSELGRAARRAIAKWFSVWISIRAYLPLEGSNCLRGKEGFLLHQFCATLETPLKKTALDKNLLLPGTCWTQCIILSSKPLKVIFRSSIPPARKIRSWGEGSGIYPRL